MKKVIKTSKTLFACVILSAFAITATTLRASNGNSFRLQQAQANATVECDCSFWGVNKNCLANNNGAQCAADGTAQCQGFNSNCGGTNPTVPTVNP